MMPQPLSAAPSSRRAQPSETDHRAAALDTSTPNESGDPYALALFHQLRTRSLVDVVRVYESLAERFSNEPDNEKREWCREALRACLASEGSCSATKYRAWWNGLQDRSIWPSANVIASAFDGWTAARSQVESTGRLDARATALRRQRRTTPDGLIKTISAYVDWLGDDGLRTRLTQSGFLNWCADRLNDPSYAGFELIVSRKPIRRHFGGWNEALQAAGFQQRTPEELTSHSRKFDSVADEDILARLRKVHSHYGRVPGERTYARDLQQGNLDYLGVVLPTKRALTDRFHGWCAAWIAAGLMTATEAAERTRTRRQEHRITERFAVEQLAEAARRFGWDINRTMYRAWRRKAKAAATGPADVPPSDAWIVDHFDGWQPALELAARVSRVAQLAAAA